MSAQELPAIVAQGSAPESAHRPAPSDARPQRPADTHLRLRGLTDDGSRLLLVDAAGLEFTVDVDARLRAALHGDPSRSDPSSQSTPPRSGPNQTTNREKTMESLLLRPRDIQARIRAGETPEAVAEAAQTTLEKVMPYAAPVLAEREHVAQRSLRASIRRPAAGSPQSPAGTSRTLGEAVSTRLRGMNVDPDSVVWDAWRREDGRWSLTASFSAGGQEGLARLTFDQPGNFVLLDNDEARWLVGDHIEPAADLETTPPEPEGRPTVRGPARPASELRADRRRARHRRHRDGHRPADRGLPRRPGHRGAPPRSPWSATRRRRSLTLRPRRRPTPPRTSRSPSRRRRKKKRAPCPAGTRSCSVVRATAAARRARHARAEPSSATACPQQGLRQRVRSAPCRTS